MRDLFSPPPPAPGNYYIDTADGRIYHAAVMLNDVEDPNKPPKVISVPTLMEEDRFLIVRYPQPE